VTSNRSRSRLRTRLDQGRAGQEAEPQSKLIAVIFREFDGLGLGSRIMMQSYLLAGFTHHRGIADLAFTGFRLLF
jgi:hypothetical protein